ncbi:NAD(P)/FAD-dependent oxidoreductase [Solimonas sp. K1W22B-7]|uniref:flavin-containing monooxygenase n=1 Tax=Solimonas sp. K1W22B-7 TaxID=2303331 RepID=UPI000E334E69|nr:NAD(P)/FAD-dependent oxidoreductase [Solimonas sp. K1W22B-7]AXQ31147.1 NAD(P)/FAD-dependent oxidoreductase [Solimonas sp. K1W22B-7]
MNDLSAVRRSSRTSQSGAATAGKHASAAAPSHLPIAIIGAGFGGIGLAIKLREAGIGDFTILERADALGGTWYHNSYPGCACDVPSALYSYSFAQNPDWSRKYGAQPEILAYLRGVAQRYEIERHIRFGQELIEAHWDEATQRWQLATNHGALTADVLVSACGPFNDPLIPRLPGLENFKGAAFHTARWDHQHRLGGRNVAVIGTGASAIQVIPAIQPQVRKLSVFQRTPTWIVPRWDHARSTVERELTRRIPLAQKAVRTTWYLGIESLGLSLFVDRRLVWPFEALGRYQLRRQVQDPELRSKLTPHFTLGCKRAVFSDAYYPALTQPNVELVTEGIREIREYSIVTQDGVEHRVDTLIFGTGFHVPGKVYERIRGRDGRTLAEVFGTQPRAYLGTTFSGCPNLFMLLGPFSAGGNQSAIYMLENQARYVVDAIRTMRARGLASVEPHAEVQEAFHEEMKERSRKTTWVAGGCKSYYQNSEGGNGGLWPNWSFLYRRRTQHFDLDNYMTRSRVESGANA